MCHSCESCNAEPRNCKTELKRRLVRALEIVDSMENDTFKITEHAQATALYDLLENVARDHVPRIRAWCTVKIYAKVHGEAEAPSIMGPMDDHVWEGHESEAVAIAAAGETQAKSKKEHKAHPWWGPWKTCGDRFVARLTTCGVDELERAEK